MVSSVHPSKTNNPVGLFDDAKKCNCSGYEWLCRFTCCFSDNSGQRIQNHYWGRVLLLRKQKSRASLVFSPCNTYCLVVWNHVFSYSWISPCKIYPEAKYFLLLNTGRCSCGWSGDCSVSFIGSLRSLFLWYQTRPNPRNQKTMHYLLYKISPYLAFLEQKFGVKWGGFLSALTKRLVARIQESNANPTRKFFNKDVTSLKQIATQKTDQSTWNSRIFLIGHLFVLASPRWNSRYKRHGNKTLRGIVDAISEDGKNSAGEYILPNSLGVSVMIQLHDGTIIAKSVIITLLRQYHGLKTSASGASSIYQSRWAIWYCYSLRWYQSWNAQELWIQAEDIPHMPEISNMAVVCSSHIFARARYFQYWSLSALVPLSVLLLRVREKNPEVVLAWFSHLLWNFQT